MSTIRSRDSLLVFLIIIRNFPLALLDEWDCNLKVFAGHRRSLTLSQLFPASRGLHFRTSWWTSTSSKSLKDVWSCHLLRFFVQDAGIRYFAIVARDCPCLTSQIKYGFVEKDISEGYVLSDRSSLSPPGVSNP